jgi:hypothetical protein
MPTRRSLSDPGASIDRKTSLLRDRPDGTRGQAGASKTPLTPPSRHDPCGSCSNEAAPALSGVREPHSACAEHRLGPISSSRCQTTRVLRTRAKARETLFTSGRAAVKRHLTEPAQATLNFLSECYRLNNGDHRSYRTHPHTISGGARRDRTDDLLLAKQALSQLSYGPIETRNTFRHPDNDASCPAHCLFCRMCLPCTMNVRR